MPTSTVAIVAVTNQGPKGPIRECLASLHEHHCALVGQVIVVDNGAAARSGFDPDDRYGPGCFTVIRSKNLGYGAALNLGLRAAAVPSGPGPDGTVSGPTVVVALNDDVTVTAGWVEPLVAALSGDRVGAVQPKLLFSDSGRVNSVGVQIGPDGAGFDIGHDEPDEGWTSGPIDVFTGGAVAMSAGFLADVGGFDERYFLYYEDVDLALRGAERGWTYRCETTSVVNHHGGASTTALGDDLRRLQERNRLWTSIRFGTPGVVGRSLWLSVRRLRHQPRRAHRRGLVEGVRASPRLVQARRRGKGAR